MTVVKFFVPRRADGGRRDELWKFCKQWWTDRFPTWEIVEGHHDDGPFNRAAAVNSAARAAGDWDVGIVLDADVVANETQVVAAVERALETGRMTLAYEKYFALRESMTERVLDGYSGDWTVGSGLRMTTHVSSIVVVPRQLWDAVHGFDERFVGWGHEDVAFVAACRVLGGGIERIPGHVFHLWHKPAADADMKSRRFLAQQLLRDRYVSTLDPYAMAELTAEPHTPDAQVCIVVPTHGRRSCIERAIPSALKHLHGLSLWRCLIVDDSNDPDYQAWLRVTFPDWELVTGKRLGYAGNVRRARDAALQTGMPFVFWLEDDFVFERDVDLAAMADVLAACPRVAQMALRRQAWYPKEIEAGGVVEQHPDKYTDQNVNGHDWLEHSLFWTMNPHLVARETLIAYDWPNKPSSEALFGRQIFRDGRTCGYWGVRTDDPWVTHFGEQTGTGY